MKIGDVCDAFDISADTLRYYEKIGILYDVKRVNGIREYSEGDLMLIDFIKNMRDAGLSINFLVQYMNLFRKGDSTFADRKQLLIVQRDILIDKIKTMKRSLEKLNYKIRWYEDLIFETEKQITDHI